jgi:hypothetical protein
MMTPAKLVVTTRKQAAPARAPRKSPVAIALLGAAFLALAAGGGAWLTAGGSGALGQIAQSFGFGGTAEIEAEQRRQALALAQLDQLVHRVAVEVGAISSRIKLADHHEATVNDRVALVDAEIAALAAELRSLRAPRNEPATWRAPVDRLDAALLDTRGGIGDLRASLDEHAQSFRKDIDAITGRLDRLELAAARDLTASIAPVAPVARKKAARKVRAIRSAQLRNGAPVPAHRAAAATTNSAAEFQVGQERSFGAPY